MPDRFPSRILVPVDFSDVSASALKYAARIAPACGAKVTVLHAYWVDVPPYFTPAQRDALLKQYEGASADMLRALEQFAANAGVPGADFRIAQGDATSMIGQVAAETRAEMIVMGTHGRRGIERFMLGSVAERVLRTSTVPVLTVGRPANPEGIRRIVCAVNNSEASRLAFRKAAQLAECLGAHLTALHIEEGGDTGIGDLCQWITAEQPPSCSIEEMRGRGKPDREILRIAGSSGADLIVVGATHKAFFDSTVLGPTTVRVVRHAPAPVLVVPAKSPAAG